MKAHRTKKAGFTLVEIMIVVAVIGTLASLAVPNYVKAVDESRRKKCISNLKQIQGFITVWGIDNKMNEGDVPTDSDLFGTDKYLQVKPTCPSGGSYTLGTVAGSNTTCSLSGNPDYHTL
jgi:prepilin-type N-terminal cleavage/methylation domain-containing protein